MSAHVSDELPRLLSGEADRDTVLACAAHLRACVDCQHELISAVVAHASLSSAHRFAPDLMARSTGASDTRWSLATRGADDSTRDAETAPEARPVEDVVTAFPGTVGAVNLGKHRGGASSEGEDAPLPDLSAMFAEVRREAGTENVVALPRRSRTRYLLGAAAAAVIVGSGAAVVAVQSGSDGNGSNLPSAGRTVQLSAYDKGTHAAVAKVESGSIQLDASALPTVSGKRYEVWLTNDKRTQLQPIGWIGANGRAAISVPSDMLSAFQDIEVSLQSLDSPSYAHSGVSVLRGSLS